MKMSLLYKISFSSLMIAIFIILSRFLSIPYFGGVPFLKLSLASSVVAFSSFYLGPIFGLIVGTFGDIIGALAFPQGEFNILFTIASSLGGLMPYLIYKILTKTKVEVKYPVVLSVILAALSIGLTIFLGLNDQLPSYYSGRIYHLELWVRITLIVAIWVISIAFISGIFIVKYKFNKNKLNNSYNITSIITSVFLTYFLFKIPISSLVFTFVYQIDFVLVYTCRNLLGFFDSFTDALIVLVALSVSLKFPVRGAAMNKDIPLIEKPKEISEDKIPE